MLSGLRSLGFLASNRTRKAEERKRRPARSVRTLLFEPLEVRQLLTATVDDLHLLNDTGSSSSDLVTSDPQVTCTAQGDFSGGYVEVAVRPLRRRQRGRLHLRLLRGQARHL